MAQSNREEERGHREQLHKKVRLSFHFISSTLTLKSHLFCLVEKFIHEHEVEVLTKLREKQATTVGKKTDAARSADAANVADDSPAEGEPVTPETLGFSPAASAGSSVLGKREGALEDQWIREHEKEKK